MVQAYLQVTYTILILDAVQNTFWHSLLESERLSMMQASNWVFLLRLVGG